ncbi:hypothetical protein GCM10028822_41020 [Hymenobacter terrigena]
MPETGWDKSFVSEPVALVLNDKKPFEEATTFWKGVPSNVNVKGNVILLDTAISACTAGTLVAVEGSGVKVPVEGTIV